MKRKWLTQLLAADLHELRGEGESEVARLVRTNAEVRSLADSIVREQAKLSEALSAMALQSESAQPTQPSAVSNRRARVNEGALGGVRRWTMASLAAAALLVLLVVRSAAPPEHSTRGSGELTRKLNAASSRPFAVIATDNPNIAIVWLFEEEDR